MYYNQIANTEANSIQLQVQRLQMHPGGVDHVNLHRVTLRGRGVVSGDDDINT